MTEKYEQAQMDVVEFPDVDIIATSDMYTGVSPTPPPGHFGPDTFLE